jgi:hypothetical protein
MYQFYHEDITLGNSLAPSGGGASFKLFLPTELVGNYSCDADNGLGAQHSEVMAFNITGRLVVPGWEPTVMPIKYFYN